MTNYDIIEAAYLAGFGPSSDNLSDNDLFSEASDYLMLAMTF